MSNVQNRFFKNIYLRPIGTHTFEYFVYNGLNT